MYLSGISIKVWDDDIWLKHITQEGSRSHVFYWSSNGRVCKEKNCIMNAPDEILTKATIENKEICVFIETRYSEAYLTAPVSKTYFQSV